VDNMRLDIVILRFSMMDRGLFSRLGGVTRLS